MCPAHTCCITTHQGLTEIPMDLFTNHAHLISSLDFSNNALQSLPMDFYSCFPSLSTLALSHNQLQTIPSGIGKYTSLTFLNLSFNKLTSLPDDFTDAMKTLRVLVLSGNPLFVLPSFVFSSTIWQELYVDQTGVKALPDVIPESSVLTTLNLADNAITHLPPSFTNLTHLVDLDLTGVRWIEVQDFKAFVTSSSFSAFFNANPLLERIDKKVCAL